jgi:hypothetical protein
MIRLLGIAILSSLCLLTPTVAYASDPPVCPPVGTLGEVHVHCVRSGTETLAYFTSHSEHTYSIRPACEVGGTALCFDPGACSVDGHDGHLYNVYRDDETDPLPWQACLTDEEAHHLGQITESSVIEKFKAIEWPASPMIVQPPGGKTLVNFDTNFYTTNVQPTTQVVPLLGHRVAIEATPISYTWHFEAGATDGDLTTDNAGAAYPDLQVTYRYEHRGTASPSVDTTYAGRYRVDDGPWRTIPDTLTVAGAAQALQVVSATPHLVGY